MQASIAATPVHYLTAGETAARILAGSLTSVEATRAYLDRIAALNPRYNIVVDLYADAALARAREADAAMARGEVWGPLHGVPVTIKDVYDVAGMRITFGWPPMRRNTPRHDAFTVARLRGAGAVIMGITNAPLGSYDWQCWNPLYGRTRNPWNAARTPGGSSGGSAAAIAAGFSALELGYSMALGAWVCLPALLGTPVVVLPVARSREGLPIGIQVVGRRWDDAGVLAVARVIERLTGGFRPPRGLE